MFEKKPRRYVIKYSENHDFMSMQIMVDRQTGVNYLLVNQGHGVSMTPLLDENGQVVRDKPENWQNEIYDQ
ncbi:MAG: hypothetical protein J1E43_01780 [Christensenellaceae bacterium]|nr:hypothetical protein [Christensenellaceae bacterium]